MSTTRPVAGLAAFILVCLAAGGIGSAVTAPAIPTWYAGLNKPSFTPPNWLFGPVWTALYIMMAVAAWLVWRKPAGAMPLPKSQYLVVFALQLELNVLWSMIFFGLRSPAGAFADIIALWCAIVATIVLFSRVSLWAGALLIPYLAWVSFAAALNFAVWRLNAGAPPA
jgi:benzodiazapine receptor